jgi:hypothetical protein
MGMELLVDCPITSVHRSKDLFLFFITFGTVCAPTIIDGPWIFQQLPLNLIATTSSFSVGGALQDIKVQTYLSSALYHKDAHDCTDQIATPIPFQAQEYGTGAWEV